MFRIFKYLALAVAAVTVSAVAAVSAPLPQGKGPVLITSLGQSPDANTISILAKRAKVEADFVTLASGADATKYNTILVVVGVSLKGFGSAGVNLDTETSRAKELIDTAKAKGALLVVVHNGGEGRRDNMTNLLVEAIAPAANAFIVYDPGNKDGFFNKMAGDRPLVLVPKAIEIAKTLEQLIPAK